MLGGVLRWCCGPSGRSRDPRGLGNIWRLLLISGYYGIIKCLGGRFGLLTCAEMLLEACSFGDEVLLDLGHVFQRIHMNILII